jgi:tetratricopeptide (TPR) repeat protein
MTIYRPEVHHELTFRYGNHDPGVCALAALGLALAARGDSEGALRHAQEAIDLSDALGHSVSRAHARALAAWACQIIGDAESAMTGAERALALEPEVEAPHFFALARAVRGWALATSGRHAKGAADLELALTAQLAVNARPYAALTAALLAETYLDHDRAGTPRAAVARLLSVPRPNSVYLGTPEILRVEARSHLGDGRPAEARLLLTEAIRVAQEQGSWMSALRAALALARMSAPGGDLSLLADLCGRLRDDNRSPDLRAARSLLGRSEVSRTIDSRSR